MSENVICLKFTACLAQTVFFQLMAMKKGIPTGDFLTQKHSKLI